MALDFPASPNVGDVFQGWRWDGVKWTAVAGSGGGIPDAPNDGTLYGRKSAAWANVSHSDITDWAANVPAPSASNPIMDGVAAPGVATAFARGDHVHPSDTTRAPINGVTFTGRVFLANDPAVTAPIEAATGRYVLATMPGENKLINSDMRIDQRNGGAAVNNITGRTFSVDRWAMNSATAANIFSAQRMATGGPAGFPYFLRLTALTSATLAAADTYIISQLMEADVVADMGFGAAGASTWCLSFWARASVIGTYSGSICNAAGTRSYPFPFAITTANTWQRITIQNQAGDTAGTWVGSGNAGSMIVRFDLGAGANFRSTGSSWQAGNFTGVNAAQSIVTTNGRTLDITGIKFETGLYCTTYLRQTLAKSMADCQRYYWQPDSLHLATGYNAAGSNVFNQYTFPTYMRATPTLTPSNITYSNGSGLTLATIGTSMFRTVLTIAAGGQGYGNFNLTADAEI